MDHGLAGSLPPGETEFFWRRSRMITSWLGSVCCFLKTSKLKCFEDQIKRNKNHNSSVFGSSLLVFWSFSGSFWHMFTSSKSIFACVFPWCSTTLDVEGWKKGRPLVEFYRIWHCLSLGFWAALAGVAPSGSTVASAWWLQQASKKEISWRPAALSRMLLAFFTKVEF